MAKICRETLKKNYLFKQIKKINKKYFQILKAKFKQKKLPFLLNKFSEISTLPRSVFAISLVESCIFRETVSSSNLQKI